MVWSSIFFTGCCRQPTILCWVHTLLQPGSWKPTSNVDGMSNLRACSGQTSTSLNVFAFLKHPASANSLSIFHPPLVWCPLQASVMSDLKPGNGDPNQYLSPSPSSCFHFHLRSYRFLPFSCTRVWYLGSNFGVCSISMQKRCPLLKHFPCLTKFYPCNFMSNWLVLVVKICS